MFSFSKPSTFRITGTAFLRFYIFRNFLFFGIFIVSISTGCRWLIIIFFFNGFFPCARRSFSISLFNSSSYQSACSCATLFRIFYCLHRLLHVLHPRRSVLYLQDYISYSLPISLKRSAQKVCVFETAGIILSKCRK